MLGENNGAKLPTGGLAVFLFACLIIPDAGFSGVVPDDLVPSEIVDGATKSETELASFGNYCGVFMGADFMKNRIIDIDGFADRGNPGSASDYDDTGFVGGVLTGGKFDVGRFTLRGELDGTLTNVSVSTDKLDPEGLDETAESEFSWIVTARGGS